MNLAFLGDALDHWKGSLFQSLQDGGVLRDFAVDPMASDLALWKPVDFLLYAKLLRIDRSQITPHVCNLADREKYFTEIAQTGDLFLDPDTGVATGKRVSIQHIAPSDIATLLGSSNRLLLVYQHVRAKRVSDRVNEVCGVLRSQIPDCQWCSYESGSVAMLFLARNSRRIETVRRHFANLLGHHATTRIRSIEVKC